MKPWGERSRVQATLLNPALLAAVVSQAAWSFEQTRDPMNWPLAFLVPPLVLHRPTRLALPRDTRTHLSTWLSRQPVLRAGFPARAAAMTPLVREGIRLGLRHDVLALSEGRMRGVDLGQGPPGEARLLLRSSALVGRWFAKTDQASTIFALLGVAP